MTDKYSDVDTIEEIQAGRATPIYPNPVIGHIDPDQVPTQVDDSGLPPRDSTT